MRLLLILFLTVFLTSCIGKDVIHETALTSANLEKPPVLPPPSLTTDDHLVAENNSALLRAYQEYQKTGVAKTIENEQFVQFPYNRGSQPIIAASVLELTVISLEKGEQVNSVSSGDPLRWSYSLVYSGNNNRRQAHIMIKPAKPAISTDFFITTDRRAYLLKLVATTNGKYVRDVRFWYPDTVETQLQTARNSMIAELPNIDASQLNFNYQLTLSGSAPAWSPQRVFDDGVHTYIQLPPNIGSGDLPVLFIQNQDQHEMVNYRVKIPYFIVDKIFSKAVLLSGVGRRQQRVTIINAGIKGGSL